MLISKNCISYEKAVSHVETFVSNTTHYNECALCSIEPPISGNNKLPNAEASISYGKYTYKETFAPEGYLLNEEMFSFEIKEDGQIIK